MDPVTECDPLKQQNPAIDVDSIEDEVDKPPMTFWTDPNGPLFIFRGEISVSLSRF